MKTKILVVEDDPHISLGLEEILKGEGFDVSVCARGDKAVEFVARTRPQLIILDVMLPERTALKYASSSEPGKLKRRF
jgi:DNA-binding response OmpR family regulator